ncbi:MAG: hypothetical protein E7374_04085 [Clostridiales bacterium]|nr:hypothetical protein [Clostridiales bacterium]
MDYIDYTAEQIREFLELETTFEWIEKIIYCPITKSYRTIKDSDFDHEQIILYIKGKFPLLAPEEKRAEMKKQVKLCVTSKQFLLSIDNMTIDFSDRWVEFITKEIVCSKQN